MGRITSDSRKQSPTTKTHFSHPHPLKLTPHLPQQTLTLPSSSCPACDLGPSGPIYSCTHCNFFLHDKCLDMPATITHPFHKEHVFSLLPRPTSPNGLFTCKACSRPGRGFSYHCQPCGLDLHVTCASMPLTLMRLCHPHELRLVFESPYGDKTGFSCDVCNRPSSSGSWLYRCDPCGFDAHLNCVLGSQEPVVGSGFRSAPSAQPQGFGPPQQGGFSMGGGIPHNAAAMGVPAVGPTVGVPSDRTQNTLMYLQAMQQIIANSNNVAAMGIQDRTQNTLAFLEGMQQIVNRNNAAAQAALAGGAGGYVGRYGGNNEGLQQLTQMMSGLNNGGGTGGGGIPSLNGFGGGGGGQELLQALMGGGNSGGEFDLQALLGGGGGGGADLQSLLGGGGGGGLIDFLGGALGGFGC